MTRDLIPAEEVLRRVGAVGQYYGFTSFASLAASMRGTKKRVKEEAPVLPALDPVAESVASFLKQCRDLGITPATTSPLFLYHTNIASGRPAPKSAVIQFHALGSDRAIADAVLIRALRTLAYDLYREEPEVHLNSMGDRETRARFARELASFFKKQSTSLPEECITCAKRDVFEGAEFLIKKECADDLPSPTDHLSDQSRKRFEELLEYLEATDTPYTLAPHLISRGPIWSETCFELRLPADSEEPGKVVAWGSRYPELMRLFFKSAVPSAGAVLRVPAAATAKVSLPTRASRIRFAFVHIGEEAKRESIKIAEELKKARLPLSQIIGLESLTEQMRLVEKMNPPYLLIMGRKEALERSAVLRNRATQEETVIPLFGLAERLKAVA